ncbi:MAG: PLP-dependent aminotransferase family protein [Pseudonocardia sp.]|nr:PLP-dependent aminotransferase family protein [Pseudonocardia sp.]
MTDSWATLPSSAVPGADLHLDLGTLSGPGLRVSLIGALRDAVRTGRLAPGSRLPSSRSLGADLGIARNTVAQAYSELVAEGWLTARQGAGTRVAERAPEKAAALPPGPRPAATRGPRHDLRPGRPDLSAFPRAQWLRAARRALGRAPDDAFGSGAPAGRAELREALAGYLARARGVRARPEQVVVTSGVGHGITLLARALTRRGTGTVAVEAYGLEIHRRLLVEAGLRTVPLPVDADGADVAALDAMPDVGAVLLTPSHQFPTGVALHPDRRAAAVRWARRTGGLVLEDDYDGEFRYDRHPVGAVQGLAPDQVCYLGTTSKSLAPGLRLGWAVLPPALAADVAREKGEIDWTTGVTDQLTLAELITSGVYDRHVRTMRARYRRRRDQLVEALARDSPLARVTGMNAGLHVLVELPAGDESAVAQGAAWQDLAVHGLARFRHPDAPADRDALVVGYATPSPSAWSGALEALCRLLP